MDEQNNLLIQPSAPLSRNHKIVAGVLFLTVIIVLVIGFRQFGKSIKAPFEITATDKTAGDNTKVEQSTDIAVLQKKDTDQDGISDYNETYVYKTNPYNADSDSDSIPDKKEIDSGSNPTCPTGQDCSLVSEPAKNTSATTEPVATQPTSNTNTSISDILNKMNADGSAGGVSAEEAVKLSAGATEKSNEDLSAMLPENLTPADIRTMLKTIGMTDDVLNQFTDEQLLSTYKATLETFKNKK